MNSVKALGKYLDQPRLVGKFSNAVPAILIAGGGLVALKHIQKTPQEERKPETIKSIFVLAGTIGSALLATRGIKPFKIGNKFFKGLEGLSERIDLKEIANEQTELINNFLSSNQVSKKTSEILNKSKEKVLNVSEIKTIFDELSEKNKEFLDKFIPNPENIGSKEIFSEIGRLSVMGLIPVVGGIIGGLAGDKLSGDNWREKLPNKVKEGTYQYLANIFLCNVGAGAALFALEKAKINSKSARAVGMIGGIILAGIVFGSAVANLVGKTFIDPLFGKNSINKKLYSERKPEAIDVGLHIDDVATVAVLSGLKWIEPALPILYSVSGYRAGIGYRNSLKGEELNG